MDGLIFGTPASSIRIGSFAVVEDDGSTHDCVACQETVTGAGGCSFVPSNGDSGDFTCGAITGLTTLSMSYSATFSDGDPNTPDFSCSAQGTAGLIFDSTPATIELSAPFQPGTDVVPTGSSVTITGADGIGLCSIDRTDEVGNIQENLFRLDAFATIWNAPTQHTVQFPLDSLTGPLTFEAHDCGSGLARKTIDFRVDRSTPAVHITENLSVAADGTLGAIRGTASDDVELADLYLTINGERFPLGGIRQSSHSWEFTGFEGTIAPFTGKAYNIRVTAIDLLGQSASQDATVIVNPGVRARARVGNNDPVGCVGTDPLSGKVNFPTSENALPPSSPALAITLSHNSQGSEDSAWGYGWSSEHDPSLLLRPSLALVWRDGPGAVRTYFPPADGQSNPDEMIAPTQSFTKMTIASRNADGEPQTVTLREKDGTERLFTRLPSTTSFALSSLTDRNGNTLLYDRNSQGRLNSITDIHGRTQTLSYNAEGRVSQVVDSAGRTASYEYSANGDKIQATSTQGTTLFAYDAAHRITKITYPNGGFREYTYDARGRVATEQENGGINAFTYEYFDDRTIVTDARGHRTEYEYAIVDGLRRTTRIIDPNLGERGFEYDAALNLTRERDPLTRETLFAYDGASNVSQVTDPLNGATLIAYEPTFNQATSLTDPRGKTTALFYDGSGNLEQVRDSLNFNTLFQYDGQGHVTQVQDPFLKTTLFGYDANGQLNAVTDPLSRQTTMIRDAAGRVTQSLDSAGKITQFQYDADGNLTRVTDHDGGVTTYDYAAGREARLLSKVVDAKQNALATGFGTVFAYDLNARLTSVTNPLGQAKSFAYDLKGNLTSATDANARTTTFAYDALDRLVTKTIPATGADPGGAVSYGYDAVGNRTSLTHYNGSALTMSYDALDRLSQTTQKLPGGFEAAIGYEYDADGNRTRMTTPWLIVDYTYDALNRLKTIIAGGQTYSFGYDALGRRTSLSFPNGVETAYSYDGASQLLGIEHKDGLLILAKSTYSYDPAGNRTTMTDLAGTHFYGYDDLHRATAAVHPAGSSIRTLVENFDYDAVGNRSSDANIGNYQYDAANRLLQNDALTFNYDGNGNTTRVNDLDSGQSYDLGYDGENQMVGVSLPGTGFSFKYDGLGRRVEKAEGGNKLQYVYDNEDIVAILDGQNNLVALFHHGPGIDEPLGMEDQTQGGQHFYLHADALGSVKAVTDQSKQVVERVEYEIFGQPTFTDLRGGAAVTSEASFTASPYAFTARERDSEIGVQLNSNRYYFPSVGRFLQEDPIGIPGGVNLFLYAINQPLKYTDPTGLRPLSTDEKALLSPYIPSVDLENADVIEDRVPWYLSDEMDGITRGNKIYLRPGAYHPGTLDGTALLGHELVHVGQYRKGATVLSFLWSYKFGYWKSRYERTAYAIQRRIYADLEGTLPRNNAGCSR